jgi:PKD repeat protein
VPFARICSACSSALLLLAAACAGSDLILPNDGGSPAIQVINGDGQTGEVGELLREPVVVKVTDASGQPLANAAVSFQLVSAGEGGEISPATDTTDQAGQAEAHLLLGDKVGLQTGEAHLLVDGSSASKATFTAVASAGTPENQHPTADFNWHCEDLSCQFTDASADPDGAVTGWSWQFGDGGTSPEAEPAHAYAEPGTYTVTLVVTDNRGANDENTTQVNVSVSAPPPPENKPPHADFDVHCRDQFCSFSDRSRDDDGSVVSWAWDFGDGTGSSERNPFHFYRDEGHYDVTLTVTDNDGGSETKTHHAEAKD